MRISLTSDGSKTPFTATTNYLKSLDSSKLLKRVLTKYAEKGVLALAEATPKDTGLTASSWRYVISQTKTEASIVFLNDNISYYNHPIVLYLQYGHSTKNGGYVRGQDFINPATKEVFDNMINDLWAEVKRL